MSQQTVLTLLDEGLKNGRITPQLAAYIAAEMLGIEARATEYDDTIRLQDESER